MAEGGDGEIEKGNGMKLPLPKFKKDALYVASRMGYIAHAKCVQTKPEVILHPAGSTFQFALAHFDWVIDIPRDQKMPEILNA